MAKRYSIYASAVLDRALAERMGGEGDDGLRSRSATITYICDRYAEICRRSLPMMTLSEWLLIFDAMNGTASWDYPMGAATGLAHNVHDGCYLNRLDEKWALPHWRELVTRLADLPFASQIAVVDAAERFWVMDAQPSDAAPDDTHPFAHWRTTVARIVGKIAED